MKKIIVLFAVLVSFSAVSNEVQLDIKIGEKKCIEMLSYSIQTSNTYMIGGHSYQLPKV